MGKEDEIHIESWNRPGYLEIQIGNNGTTRVFNVAFHGLDPEITSLDQDMIPSVIEQICQHQAELKKGSESVGLRRLRLCEYTIQQLEKLLNPQLEV